MLQKNIRCLLVEPDRRRCNYLKAFLESLESLQVDSAFVLNAQGAAQALRRQDFDLLIANLGSSIGERSELLSVFRIEGPGVPVVGLRYGSAVEVESSSNFSLLSYGDLCERTLTETILDALETRHFEAGRASLLARALDETRCGLSSLGRRRSVLGRAELISAEIESRVAKLKEHFPRQSLVVEELAQIERLASGIPMLEQSLDSLNAPSVGTVNLGAELEDACRLGSALLPDALEFCFAKRVEIELAADSASCIRFALTELIGGLREIACIDYKNTVELHAIELDLGNGTLSPSVQARYRGELPSGDFLAKLEALPFVAFSFERDGSDALVSLSLRQSCPSSKTAAQSRKLALIAEDEGVLRFAIRKMLEGLGYETVIAENGAQAVEQFAQGADEYSLVLLDLQMPELDGYGALSCIRIEQPKVPVILMSGDMAVSQDDEREAKEHNCRYLPKPFAKALLEDTVRSLEDGFDSLGEQLLRRRS